MLKTTSAFGTKIVSDVLPTLTDTYAQMLGAPAVGRYVFTLGNKLFSPQFQRLIPTPLILHGVGRVYMEVCPKPPLAFPTRKDKPISSSLYSEQYIIGNQSSHPTED